MGSSIWNDRELLSQLEDERDRKRGDGRISYDCFHLKLRDNRVYCDKGKLLGPARDGSLSLLYVLRGVCSGACRECKEYYDDGGV